MRRPSSQLVGAGISLLAWFWLGYTASGLSGSHPEGWGSREALRWVVVSPSTIRSKRLRVCVVCLPSVYKRKYLV